MDTEQKKKPGLPSRLTPMQMKFAELLIYFEGRKFAYECAVEAGYSKDTARSQASQLLKGMKKLLAWKNHLKKLNVTRS